MKSKKKPIIPEVSEKLLKFFYLLNMDDDNRFLDLNNEYLKIDEKDFKMKRIEVINKINRYLEYYDLEMISIIRYGK